MIEIVSEDPEQELWRQISRFGYEANVDRIWRKHHNGSPNSEQLATIVGSVLQAQEYVSSSRRASLHVAPLLAYYGAVALAHAAGSILAGAVLPISGHGAKCKVSELSSLAKVEVQIHDKNHGALPLLTAILGGGGLEVGSRWSLQRAFGAIPDMHADYVQCYPDTLPGTVPLTTIRTRKGDFDRIDTRHLPAEYSPASVIPEYAKSYITPQLPQGGDHWILRRKLRWTDPAVKSISGQRFLEVRSAPARPLTLISAYLIGLYALAFLSRYRTHLWTPFVRIDSTGEQILVGRFVDLSRRQLPNLILNALLGTEIRLVSLASYERDKRLSEETIREIIDERITNKT